MPGKGLYANIQAKRKRIAEGSGEKMRKVGSPGAQQLRLLKSLLRQQRNLRNETLYRCGFLLYW